MIQKAIIVVWGLFLVLCVAGAGFAADPPQAQTVCPVLGGHIDKSIHADHQGNRVYFCCSGCIDSFQKNPAQYLKKLEEQGVAPEKSPGGK